MADTQTENFGFTLIGIGGSRDSWGAKLNANLVAIDAALDGARDAANAALPKAGGAVTGEILRSGQGAHIHWVDDAMDRGQAYLTPSSGTDPTGQPGDVWFGYTP